MSRKYKFGDSGKLHFISFAVVYWIDWSQYVSSSYAL